MTLRCSPDLADLRYLWVTNAGAAEITANSVGSLTSVAPETAESVVIGCLDRASLGYFRNVLPQAQLLTIFDWPPWSDFARVDANGSYGNYGTLRFRDVSFARYFALLYLMDQDRSPVLYIDGDVAFRSDPRQPLRRAAWRSDAAVLFQSDRQIAVTADFDADGYLANEDGLRPNFCTGFACWLNPDRTQTICRRLLARRDLSTQDGNDQLTLRQFDQSQLCDVVTLPEATFLNGSGLFTPQGQLALAPAEVAIRLERASAVHVNWMVGMSAKIRALQAIGLWSPPTPAHGFERCPEPTRL